MKLLVALAVVTLVGLSMVSDGLFSALAELAAFVVVIAWVLKTKQTNKKHKAPIEPHV